MVIKELKDHQQVIQKVIDHLGGDIEAACIMITAVIQNGKKVLLAGNGGSAADAQHIAAELSGRFVKERRALPGIALTVDTSALTQLLPMITVMNMYFRARFRRCLGTTRRFVYRQHLHQWQ